MIASAKSKVILLAMLCLGVGGQSASAEVLDQPSRELAFCSDVLAYGVNWFMLNDNQGAAKIITTHYARAVAALFTMHYENGKVPGAKMAQFKAVGAQAKPYLDANPGRVAATMDACIELVNKQAEVQSRRRIMLWEKDWEALVEHLSSGLRSKIGL
jgi:hypothetical protein